jgi:hypothetical protein
MQTPPQAFFDQSASRSNMAEGNRHEIHRNLRRRRAQIVEVGPLHLISEKLQKSLGLTKLMTGYPYAVPVTASWESIRFGSCT